MKHKKLLSFLLTLALVVSMFAGMSIKTYATEKILTTSDTTWSGDYIVSSNLQMGNVEVTGDTVLTINEDVTLEITGYNDNEAPVVGIIVPDGKTLTIKGTGTLVVWGGYGEDGSINEDGYDGCNAINNNGIINLQSGNLTINGGSGGDGYGDEDIRSAYDGGNGGIGISGGTLKVSGGALSVVGGAGGDAGDIAFDSDNALDDCKGGNGGTAISVNSLDVTGGSVTATGGNEGQTCDDSNEGAYGIGIADDTSINASTMCINGEIGSSKTVTIEPFTITCETVTGGTVTADKTSSVAGGTVTLTVSPSTGYEFVSLSVKDADNTVVETTQDASDSTKYTFTMPTKAVTVTATFKQSGNAVTIDSTIQHGTVGTDKTTAAKNATVTLTVTPSAGYKFGSLSVKDADNTVVETTQDASDSTKYTFTMPDKAVTVSATFAELSTTGDVTLDLEDGDEDGNIAEVDTNDAYADHSDIEQYYIRTTGEKTITNNCVKYSWTNKPIQIKVKDSKKWDPSNLCWTTGSGNGDASLTSGTNDTTFTFKNYSTKKFSISTTFSTADGVVGHDSSKDSLVYVNSDSTLANNVLGKIEVGADGVADVKYFTDSTKATVNENALPTVTLTATIGIDASGFNNASTTSSAQKYGTYTFTLTAVD